MIVPDLNLLVYAYNDGAPHHEPARRWWEDLVNGTERVGVPWVVSTGFVRLMTHPSVLVRPAARHARRSTTCANGSGFPTSRRSTRVPSIMALLRRNLAVAGVGANLVTDSHIAAVAIEYQAEIHSNDTDFSRFPGLRWRNPL